MAIGDKKPVVMEFDKAVPEGVATLDEFGKLETDQRPDYTISQVTGLESALSEKAVKTEVGEHFTTLDSTTQTATENIESLQSDMEQAQTDISGLKTGKADAATVTSLSTTVSGLQTSKAEQTALTTVENNVKSFAYIPDGAGPHNAVYRGISLGTTVTAEQYAAISAGTFKGMFIGDYWTISSRVYRIAAFDYYFNVGDNSVTTQHHVVIVPDASFGNVSMNSTDTTNGGYVGSDMFKTGLETARTAIKAAFPNHVLSHRKFLVNAVTNGTVSGAAWTTVDVDLMTEQNVYGSSILESRSTPTVFQWTHTVDKSQFPLFAHRPDMIIASRVTYWLQNVCSSVRFAFVYGYGFASCSVASYAFGVRPAFCIS